MINSRPHKRATAGKSVVDMQVAAFIQHLWVVESAFNNESRAQGIGVEISVADIVDGLRRKARIKRATDYASGVDDSGILHPEQVVTAVKAIAEIVRGNEQVLVQGPMQSGKTTTSLALQLVAPAYYLVIGKPLYPFYLLTASSSQFEQTHNELQRFVMFYSEIAFRRTGKVVPLSHRDALFDHAPTLENYRESVIKDALKNGLYSQQLTHEDFMSTRVMGEKISGVAARMKKIYDSKFVPLLIIDEPQFGQMDRIVVDKATGKARKVESVFKRMFRKIEEVNKIPKGSHVFVALSATPYELFDVEGVKVVQQKIGPGYQGFNFFAGNAIDDEADCPPPRILSLTETAAEFEEPFLAKINLAALNKPSRFVKMRKRLRLSLKMTHKQYHKLCVSALRGLLMKIADQSAGEDFGVCVRARNNNDFARKFGDELGLESTYETLHFSGIEARNKSVKRVLATERKDSAKPYLLFVTNRARMGDAFPKSARFFIELTAQFTDMNSMFQGFIGRSCGYGKNSTVILSDSNAMMVRTVIDVQGRYVFTASRGSVILNRKRRGRPSGLVVIERAVDTNIEEFFAMVDAGFRNNRLVTNVSKKLKLKRNRGGNSPGLSDAPIFKYATKSKFFDFVENRANRDNVAKGYPDFHIVRENEKVRLTGAVTDEVGYALDGNGGCAVIAREYSDDLRQSGVRGRGSKKTLTPQIVFVKFDRKTGQPILDDPEYKKTGEWKAYAIVLPLSRSVTPQHVADVALPKLDAIAADLLSRSEKEAVTAATRKGPPTIVRRT